MKKAFLLFALLSSFLFAQNLKVLKSTNDYVDVQVDFGNSYFLGDTVINDIEYDYVTSSDPILADAGSPALPIYTFKMGIPHNAEVSVKILKIDDFTFDNKFILPQPSMALTEEGVDDKLNFNKEVYSTNSYFPKEISSLSGTYVYRLSNIASIAVSPYQFNPVTRKLKYNKTVNVRVYIKSGSMNNISNVADYDMKTDEMLKKSVVNYNQAQKWTGLIKPEKTNVATDWYNPTNVYAKIFVQEKGIYRVYYDQLDSLGYQMNSIMSDNLRLFCNGEEVPIQVFDGENKIFSSGDYFQFVGFPPKATEYARQNIYNTKNVYWLTYDPDSTGLRYQRVDGYPVNEQIKLQNTNEVIHLEEDLLFERFGHAEDLNRDNWQWAVVSGRDGSPVKSFTAQFRFPANWNSDNKNVKLTYSVHGMEKTSHNPEFRLLSQDIGDFYFTGQESIEYSFERDLDSFSLAPTINLQVITRGGNYASTDEIRVNWIDIKYNRLNRVFGNYFAINSPQDALNRRAMYEVWRWYGDSLWVYIPGTNELLTNTRRLNNEYQTFQFMHTATEPQEYFCFDDGYYSVPDSFSLNSNSDLLSTSNGADYIIITHPDFMEAAEQLAEFRRNNLDGFDNPRVKIVNVFDIYNEFSFGLLDPEAIREFTIHAFFSWQLPRPSYVALLGDMSWDYRGLLEDSRKNYLPSMATKTYEHGYTVADNLYAAVSGDDVMPDMAIGRISCETPEEAQLLVDKIVNYPNDPGKEWVQNTLLIGAGQNTGDEQSKGFNDQSLFLDNNYIQEVGFNSTKVFYFPNKESHEPFKGGTPEIRQGFNDGCIMANFYGHGGGYQWDAVFLNDDIYLLENEGRMPFVTSITCYTAHFDNQKVFGENFNLAAGRGSIGFFGHTGITLWNYGVDMNKRLYNYLFLEGEEVLGDAVLLAKTNFNGILTNNTKDHLNCLTLLGDPALKLALPEYADFAVGTSNISINPSTPLVDDSTNVYVDINNIGRYIDTDSVYVRLEATGPDTSFVLGTKKIASFRDRDTLEFGFTPRKDGIFTFTASVNMQNQIEEIDFSDNIASANFAVFSIAEPSLVKPYDGAVVKSDNFEVTIADVAEYVERNLTYYVEIDTSLEFNDPMYQSAELIPEKNGVLEYAPSISAGKYFLRSRIREGEKYSYWSPTITFTISDNNDEKGYHINENQLKILNYSNMQYNESISAMVMNRTNNPPEPKGTSILDEMMMDTLMPADVHSLTAIATDGSYIYFGHMGYFGVAYDNFDEATPIYKVGTGYNGTTRGVVEGPISENRVPIWKSMFHLDGALYFAQLDPNFIMKLDLATGDTSSIYVPAGFYDDLNTLVQTGGSYVQSDGRYVYNLAFKDTLDEYYYTMRMFDPYNEWEQVGDDIVLTGSSYEGFSGFFIAEGILYVFEKNISNYVRQYSLETHIYINEWKIYGNSRFDGFYTYCYDRVNDKVYGSTHYGSKPKKFSIFRGTYNEGLASIETPQIGPASEWGNINYNIDSENSLGVYNVKLTGRNVSTNSWVVIEDTLDGNYTPDDSLNGKYDYLKMNFDLKDNSEGDNKKLSLHEINVQYTSFPEIIVSEGYFRFAPDSLLQGFDLYLELDIKNVGDAKANNVKIDLSLNDADSAFYSTNIDIDANTEITLNDTINTSTLLFDNTVKVNVESATPELYTFNNIAKNSFYVSRDSLIPTFDISFDGREIIDGDLVSSRPEVLITLKDNSPLPLVAENFYIYYDHAELQVQAKDSMQFNYTPYPDSKAEITWTPLMNDGPHRLEVLAKDASNNFFDSTQYVITFRVDTENKIEDIYNYPNPFTDDTWFTFTLTGSETPQELQIRIYTVTGRLIRVIDVMPNEMEIKLLNKIYWDGRDQDGDTIANGVYLYKVIAKYPDKNITEIKKLAKVK